jgi:hypothetical protein
VTNMLSIILNPMVESVSIIMWRSLQLK